MEGWEGRDEKSKRVQAKEEKGMGNEEAVHLLSDFLSVPMELRQYDRESHIQISTGRK